MLSKLGFYFKVIPAFVNEDYVSGETPAEHVARLSIKKADKIAGEYRINWVLSADTVVVLDGDILGKPDGRDDAKMMLERLSGRVHEVYTGYCLKNIENGGHFADLVISKVKIKKLSDREIEFYLNTDEPYDKAGGYAVQGIGAFMVDEIIGSYTNVVGLPLCQVVEKMESLGIVKL